MVMRYLRCDPQVTNMKITVEYRGSTDSFCCLRVKSLVTFINGDGYLNHQLEGFLPEVLDDGQQQFTGHVSALRDEYRKA